MKKLISSVAVAFFMTFLFSSCEKEGITKTNVINVEMAPNTNYSYAIPNYDMESDAIHVTQQGTHYSKLQITAFGVFNYTPALNYVGSDEVQISMESEVEKQCGNGPHNSSRHHGNITVYDFRITVKGNIK